MLLRMAFYIRPMLASGLASLAVCFDQVWLYLYFWTDSVWLRIRAVLLVSIKLWFYKSRELPFTELQGQDVSCHIIPVTKTITKSGVVQDESTQSFLVRGDS